MDFKYISIFISIIEVEINLFFKLLLVFQFSFCLKFFGFYSFIKSQSINLVDISLNLINNYMK